MTENLSLAEDYTVSVVPTTVMRILDAIGQLVLFSNRHSLT